MPTLTPGAVVLFAGTGPIDACIRLAQRCRPSLRINRNYRFTHAAIAVSPTQIVEAVFPRVRLRTVEPDERVTVIDLGLTPGQEGRITGDAIDQIGRGYALLDVLNFGLTLATGKHLPFLDPDDEWCSQLVCRALAAGDIDVGVDTDCAPASLAAALLPQPAPSH